MIKEKLRDYFGSLLTEQEQFIDDEFEIMTEAEQDKVFAFITENADGKKGCPKIDFFQNVLNTVKPKKTYYWAVCNYCKTLYDYQLPVCPKCYEEGYMCSSRSVETSNDKPPFKIIRFNKHFLNGDQAEVNGCGRNSCYDCENNSYKNVCFHFGDHNYQCSEEQFRGCMCSRCCSFHRKENDRHFRSRGIDISKIIRTKRA